MSHCGTVIREACAISWRGPLVENVESGMVTGSMPRGRLEGSSAAGRHGGDWRGAPPRCSQRSQREVGRCRLEIDTSMITLEKGECLVMFHAVFKLQRRRGLQDCAGQVDKLDTTHVHRHRD